MSKFKKPLKLSKSEKNDPDIKNCQKYIIKFLILIFKYLKSICTKTSIKKTPENNAKCIEISALVSTLNCFCNNKFIKYIFTKIVRFL